VVVQGASRTGYYALVQRQQRGPDPARQAKLEAAQQLTADADSHDQSTPSTRHKPANPPARTLGTLLRSARQNGDGRAAGAKVGGVQRIPPTPGPEHKRDRIHSLPVRRRGIMAAERIRITGRQERLHSHL
jgi:hypothetical protein